MKILLIHNQYQQPGGEDSVFKAERELLSKYGHKVEYMIYHNSAIKTLLDKVVFGLKTIYNPDSAKALANKIRDFNPDVIHVHNFLPIVSPSILFTAKKHSIPVVLTLHNYRLICPSATLFYHGKIYEKSIHSQFPFDAIWKGVYRNSKTQTAIVALMTTIHRFLGTWQNKVDRYITLTQFGRNRFENSILALETKKFCVKPNFVEDYGNATNEREDFFLFIGRLSEEKGIRTLLKAASLHNFRLTIIGDGPLKQMVEESTQRNPLIRYLGFQGKAVIKDNLKRCKALIFPSIWYESFGLTIIEAFSTGTPVIASNLG
ncbi:MAG TPA: glycosyltransferase, partial [Cyclobacteriaceae bacterium]|nr:glycosyltransferase [Cyclobacteriaceae bacterium]